MSIADERVAALEERVSRLEDVDNRRSQAENEVLRAARAYALMKLRGIQIDSDGRHRSSDPIRHAELMLDEIGRAALDLVGVL